MAFEPGHAKIPGSGRPKGSSNKFSITEMQKALKRVAKELGKKSAYDHVARQFFTDNTAMIALMRKLLPDLKAIELISLFTNVAADTEEAEVIRKKLLERMGEDGSSNNISD